MRRLLCLLLTVFLLLSSFCAVYAEDGALTENINQSNAVEYLKALGVLDVEATYDISAGITRGEFARLVCIAGGYSPDATDKVLYFDVTSLNENMPYINALAAANIIAEGGQFRPDDVISAEEAVTMLIRVLGYDYRAKSNGGYPNGFMFTAKRLGVLDKTGLALGDKLTFGETSLLLVNALNTEVMRQTVFGPDEYFEAREGITLSYEAFRVFHIKGIVDAVELSALKGENALSPYYVSIGGNLVYLDGIDPEDFLGFEVDAYCLYERENARNILKFICATDRNEALEIPISEISSIEAGEIEYYDESGNFKTKSYNPVIPVIFNKAATGKYLTYDSLKDLEGSIKLLDNNGDRNPDVIYVKAYEDIVVAEIDSAGKRVYDKYDKKNYLSVDTTVDDPYTIVFDAEGKEITLGKIKTDNILSIYKSYDDADQKYVEIHASEAIAEGKLEKITKKNSETVLTVDGTKYTLTSNCYKNCQKYLKLGDVVKLYLNKAGYVADMGMGESSMNLGYLVAVDFKNEGLNNPIKLKIYNFGESFVDIETSDEFKIDDKEYANTDAKAIDALDSAAGVVYSSRPAACYTQPIRYRLNDEGKITFIDTVNKSKGIKATSKDIDTDNALYMGAVSDSYYYGPSAGHFYFSRKGRFVFGENTKCMNVPNPTDNSKDYTDADEYLAYAKNTFEGDTTYELKPFFFTENSLAVDLIITHNVIGDASLYTKPDYVVRSVDEALDEDGEVVYEITAVGSGGEATFTCAKDLSFDIDDEASMAADLLLGDVVCIGADGRNKVKTIELHYRLSNDSSGGSFTHNSALAIAKGFVKNKQTVGFTLVDKPKRADIPNATEDEIMLVPYWKNCAYVIYDKAAQKDIHKVMVGSYSDIFAYDDVENSCSYVLTEVRTSGLPYLVIIVK